MDEKFKRNMGMISINFSIMTSLIIEFTSILNGDDVFDFLSGR
jgi:hypothetical protein